MNFPVRELIDPKTVRILSLLFMNEKKFFHLQMISKSAKVPLSTTFRIVNKLVKLNFIERTTVGKIKIYRIAKNRETEKIRRLIT